MVSVNDYVRENGIQKLVGEYVSSSSKYPYVFKLQKVFVKRGLIYLEVSLVDRLENFEESLTPFGSFKLDDIKGFNVDEF